MGSSKDKVNKNKERNCVTLGEINIYKKIDSDTRKQEWDFLKGCWRDKPPFRGGWDLRYSS